jgi:hypothetical protein
MSDAAALDLVIRNADIATAADRFTADIGVRDGLIVAQPGGTRDRGEFLPALRPQLARPHRPLNPRIDTHRMLPRLAFPAVYRE